MRDDSPSRQQRIRDIVDQLSRLTAELNSLILDPVPPPPAPPDPPIPVVPEEPDDPPRSTNPNSTAYFRVGDRVVVTTNRNGLRGSRGTVTNLNDRFVYFRLDNTDTVVWRAPRNIQRTHPPP